MVLLLCVSTRWVTLHKERDKEWRYVMMLKFKHTDKRWGYKFLALSAGGCTAFAPLLLCICYVHLFQRRHTCWHFKVAYTRAIHRNVRLDKADMCVNFRRQRRPQISPQKPKKLPFSQTSTSRNDKNHNNWGPEGSRHPIHTSKHAAPWSGRVYSVWRASDKQD